MPRTWKKWTKDDDEMLAELWHKYPAEKIAKMMGRSAWSVISRASDNNLGAGAKKGRRWTEKEDVKLEKLWEKKEPLEVIARKLKRTVAAVKRRVTFKGLGYRLLLSDGVAITVFLKVLFNLNRAANSHEIKRYIDTGAPWFYCYIENHKCRIINLDKFWAWDEKNSNVFELSKIEPLSLGKEPNWMRDYRRQRSLQKSAERWGEYVS